MRAEKVWPHGAATKKWVGVVLYVTPILFVAIIAQAQATLSTCDGGINWTQAEPPTIDYWLPTQGGQWNRASCYYSSVTNLWTHINDLPDPAGVVQLRAVAGGTPSDLSNAIQCAAATASPTLTPTRTPIPTRTKRHGPK